MHYVDSRRKNLDVLCVKSKIIRLFYSAFTSLSLQSLFLRCHSYILDKGVPLCLEAFLFAIFISPLYAYILCIWESLTCIIYCFVGSIGSLVSLSTSLILSCLSFVGSIQSLIDLSSSSSFVLLMCLCVHLWSI